MTFLHTLPTVALCLALTACGGSESRFGSIADTTRSTEKVQTRYTRIEVNAVTLPIYADGEEIHVRGADGAIKPLGPLWSDAPGRALTLQIARELGDITGRLVAPEPWPFREPPDVRIDVRLEDFFATEHGTFRISGVVFTAPEEIVADRARTFEIEAPVAEPGDPSAISSARAQAVLQLSNLIARHGLN